MTGKLTISMDELEELSWVDVEGSSNIERVSWEKGEKVPLDDEARGALFVQFAGGRVYEYEHVPEGVWDELHTAIKDPHLSAGAFVAVAVRDNFDVRSIVIEDG